MAVALDRGRGAVIDAARGVGNAASAMSRVARVDHGAGGGRVVEASAVVAPRRGRRMSLVRRRRFIRRLD
ncbi:hypothetical protein [Nannocystis pusilla]|uniref:hypothetical protein n=1 Tax=Nannocystis pusilla TaxID=889268 RepID=UPI003BEFAD8E